eukprot:749666-Hanusia_phi.AAC.5
MDRGSQGDRFMQMGKFDAAAASYTEALRTSKDLTEIVRLLSSKCDALLSAKRFDEARMEAEQLIKLKPEWSQGHYRLGKAALAMEEFEVAEGVSSLHFHPLFHDVPAQAFGKAVELVPGNEKFEQGLKETQVQMAKAMGNAAFKEAAFEEAIQHYTIAIDLNPSHSDVYVTGHPLAAPRDVTADSSCFLIALHASAICPSMTRSCIPPLLRR